jgi:hypothetical protein
MLLYMLLITHLHLQEPILFQQEKQKWLFIFSAQVVLEDLHLVHRFLQTLMAVTGIGLHGVEEVEQAEQAEEPQPGMNIALHLDKHFQLQLEDLEDQLHLVA